jgi:hypothetical protein
MAVAPPVVGSTEGREDEGTATDKGVGTLIDYLSRFATGVRIAKPVSRTRTLDGPRPNGVERRDHGLTDDSRST